MDADSISGNLCNPIAEGENDRQSCRQEYGEGRFGKGQQAQRRTRKARKNAQANTL
jgi:hypothetical protein